MLTILEVLERTTTFFEGKGMENPRLNAELILAHGLGLPQRMDFYMQFNRPLEDRALEQIRPLVKRRAGGEPVQYIEGKASFIGVDFKVDARVLIPRPETEELIEHIAEKFESSAPQSILDLGTGSGVIALSLCRLFPQARITASDSSMDALSVARDNAAAQGLEERVDFLESDWLTAIRGTFDLIVSNPPYLSESELALSATEVREHEPRCALASTGENGEDCLLSILRGSISYLNRGGVLAMETGIHQRDILMEEAGKLGYDSCHQHADHSGRDRFFFAECSACS